MSKPLALWFCTSQATQLKGSGLPAQASPPNKCFMIITSRSSKLATMQADGCTGLERHAMGWAEYHMDGNRGGRARTSDTVLGTVRFLSFSTKLDSGVSILNPKSWPAIMHSCQH